MITKLYLHELDMNESQLLKKNYPENDILIIEILDSYEIAFMINFSKPPELKSLLENIKILNSDFNIENINQYSKFTFLFFEDKGTTIKIDIKNGKIIKFYGKIIENSKLIKNIINIFKFPVLILENNLNEPIIKFTFKNEIKNFFTFKEINFYIDLFNIHTGLTFYLIKYHLKKILKFLELNNKDFITNQDIVIQNSFSNLMNQKLKKRWRINKKHHVLNISNVKKFNSLDIYLNIKNNKFYIKKENEIYNIKNFMILNRKNILKIKEKYNRSNEILGIFEYKNNKYIIKITKSISKNLEEKLKTITINEYIEKFIK